MNSANEIVQSLNSVLGLRHPQRVELVKAIQNRIWDDESTQDERLNEILTELAYDLDFYEPNEEWRKEDPSYFGDERLEELILQRMQKIERFTKSD